MARAAAGLGHEYLVLTDHSPRLTIAHGLNRERLLAQLDEIDAVNEELAPFRILTGMEVDILEDGTLDQDDDLLERLDVVVASVHSKLRMPEQQMTERMVLAVASPHVDILGHCTDRKVVGKGRPRLGVRRRHRVRRLRPVRAPRSRSTAGPSARTRPRSCWPSPSTWGCKVAIDTDAHAPGQLEWQAYGCDKAARLGIEPDDIVNTMAADDLLAWTADHPTA